MSPDISFDQPWGLLVIVLGLALGGILKGATGAGMPVIAVPVIAAFYDVRFAVIVLVIPNLLSNLWQMFKYRSHNLQPVFTRNFALSGAMGAIVGTAVLAWLPTDALNMLMTLIIVAYIALRLLKPAFQIPLKTAQKLSWFAGTSGGVLQGALGLSAPIAITFVNAVKLERPTFIFTLSTFFAAMSAVQIPTQIAYGMMSWTFALLGLFAFIPMLAGLPVGDWIGKRMNSVIFDRVILAFLAFLAAKQVITTVFM